MLIKCQNCGISFDHKMGRCAACGTVAEPTGEQRIVTVAEDATNWLRNGEKKAAIRARLTSQCKLSDTDADEVMKRASSTLKGQSRAQGRHIVTSGIILVLIAGAIYVFSAGVVFAKGCFLIGVTMIVLGEIKVITGWNITGRDDD